jgi:hypothetical protein
MNRDTREVIREEPLVCGRLLGLLGDRRSRGRNEPWSGVSRTGYVLLSWLPAPAPLVLRSWPGLRLRPAARPAISAICTARQAHPHPGSRGLPRRSRGRAGPGPPGAAGAAGARYRGQASGTWECHGTSALGRISADVLRYRDMRAGPLPPASGPFAAAS